MRQRSNPLGLLIVSALALSALSGAVLPGVADAAALDASELDLVAQINAFRSSRALPTLAVSPALVSAAKWMSGDMAVKNYFAHTSSDGRSPVQRMQDAGYPARSTWTGEDLAAGYTSPQSVLDGWIASPGHYAVLVNANYRAIGVARAYGQGTTYGWYWTADFGGIVDGASAPPAAATAPAAPAPAIRAAPAPRSLPQADLIAEPVLVVDHGYHARWVAQSPDPLLAPLETATLTVALQNEGSRGWYVGVPGQQANLATADPRDADRSSFAVRWLSANRLATTTTPYVGPGETAWFQFSVRAPAAAGDYTLRLCGVIDGTTWLEDDGIFFAIQVRERLAVFGMESISFAP